MTLTDKWIPKLNKGEREAIGKLYRLARVWPSSLMLFSNNGNLEILHKTESGRMPMDSSAEHDAHVVANLGQKIPNDGGDAQW